ncbi:unnamed protein product [Sphagnum balticum]
MCRGDEGRHIGRVGDKVSLQLILDCYLRAVDDSALPYITNQWALGTRHVFLSHGAYLQLQTLKQMLMIVEAQNSNSRQSTRPPPVPAKSAQMSPAKHVVREVRQYL